MIRTVIKLTKGKEPHAVAMMLLQKQFAAVYQTAEWIMDKSRDLVPVDTGALRASAFVELPVVEGLKVTVTFGYGGVSAGYALMVHENPRSGKTGGVSPTGEKYKSWAKVGQWKYLEIPFQDAKSKEVFSRILKRLIKSAA